jgi:hypothetical protein
MGRRFDLRATRRFKAFPSRGRSASARIKTQMQGRGRLGNPAHRRPPHARHRSPERSGTVIHEAVPEPGHPGVVIRRRRSLVGPDPASVLTGGGWDDAFFQNWSRALKSPRVALSSLSVPPACRCSRPRTRAESAGVLQLIFASLQPIFATDCLVRHSDRNAPDARLVSHLPRRRNLSKEPR